MAGAAECGGGAARVCVVTGEGAVRTEGRGGGGNVIKDNNNVKVMEVVLPLPSATATCCS